jgi:hypothetical protein
MVAAIGGAVGGVAAAGAVVVAWVQLRRVAESSRASVRPYVQVDFSLQHTVSIDPATPGDTVVYVDVVNTGRTPAYDLTLRVVPTLNLQLSRAKPEYKQAVAKRLDGEHPIAMLAAGARLRLFLGYFNEVQAEGLPESYEVTATYFDSFRASHGPERFALRLADWSEGAAQADPLARISKDLQGIAKHLAKVATR